MPDGTVSLKPWAPQPGPQWAAIDAAWCPELLFGGARGGGKSDYLLGDYCADVAEFGEDWRGIIFRKTYPELEEIIFRSQQIIPATFPGAEWTDGNKTWALPGGATLKMRYLERDADAARYQGHQYTWIGWDELGNWASIAPYKLLMACLRNGNRPVARKRIRGSANPGGPGHHWVKGRFIDPAPQGFQPIADPQTGIVRMFIPARLADNQILVRNDPDYESRLRGVGSEQLVRAWLEGDWSIIEGAFFDCWSAARHVIRPCVLPAHWMRFRSGDWGSAKPFSFGWWAVASEWFQTPEGHWIPPGALIRYREWYGCKPEQPNTGLKMVAEAVGQGLLSRDASDTIQYGVLDPSAFAEDGGPSIAERIYRGADHKVMFRRADNARVSQRGAMGGWDAMRSRLIGQDFGEPYGTRPMIYCFSTCLDSIRTIPAQQHDKDRPEDMDSDGEDHAADDWRYACMSRPWKSDTIKAPPPMAGLSELTLNQVWKDLGKRTEKRI